MSTRAQSLEFALNSASPCDECRHSARCEADLLACDAWAGYLLGGIETRWNFAPRAPTRARYESLPAFRLALHAEPPPKRPYSFHARSISTPNAEQMVQRVGRQRRFANPLLPSRSGRFSAREGILQTGRSSGARMRRVPDDLRNGAV